MALTGKSKSIVLIVLVTGMLVAGWLGARALLFAPVEITIAVTPSEQVVTIQINQDEQVQFTDQIVVEVPQGSNRVAVIAPGYFPLNQDINALSGAANRVELALQPMPGLLEIAVVTDIDGPLNDISVRVNGELVGVTPFSGHLLDAGTYQVTVDLPSRYVFVQESDVAVEIVGRNEMQRVTFPVVLNEGEVTIETIPEGATVTRGRSGEILGSTPLTTTFRGGETHELEVMLDREHLPWNLTFDLLPGEEMAFGPHEFEPRPAKLTIETNPAGAQILINGTPRGTSPLTLDVSPGKMLAILATKQNSLDATEEVLLRPGQTRTVQLALPSVNGTLAITSDPTEAPVFIDGSLVGLTPLQEEFPAGEYEVAVRVPGETPQNITVEVIAGLETKRHVSFVPEAVTKAAAVAALPETFEAPGGITMKLIRPGQFMRRDVGIGAGMTEVFITEPFYVSVQEISNQHFVDVTGKPRGQIQRRNFDMTLARHPAVRVNWNDAVRFCNIVSDRLKVPKAYEVDSSGTPESGDVLTGGFRLPTEAEFDYLLRFALADDSNEFIWGNEWTPPARSGNFADASAGRVDRSVSIIPGGYDDGQSFTASVSSFGGQGPGLNHLVGNVWEWCHDTFARASYWDMAGERVENPVNATTGRVKVVKGGSFLTFQRSELSINWRGGRRRDETFDDVGFRIVIPAQTLREIL